MNADAPVTRDEPRFDPEFRVPPRLTVVGSVTFQAPHTEAMGVPGRWSQWLTEDEQPWSRQLIVGPEWAPACKGSWIDRSCLLLLQSRERQPTTTRPPTEQEAADLYLSTIEVGLMMPGDEPGGRRTAHDPPRREATVEPLALIPPAAETRLTCPNFDLSRLVVRARRPSVCCLIVLYPC